jgi:hypothetical protein
MSNFDQCHLDKSVNSAVEQLERANKNTIVNVLDGIHQQLKGATIEENKAFAEAVNQKLAADNALPSVTLAYAGAEHEGLWGHNKRLKENDLLGIAENDHAQQLFLEEKLVRNLADPGEMQRLQHEKKEHKFLWFGNKQGVDQKRLEKDAQVTDRDISAREVRDNFGDPASFEQLRRAVSPDKSFITKADIDRAVAAPWNSTSTSQVDLTHLTDEQRDALKFVQANFKHISHDIHTGCDCDGRDEYTRGIDFQSLDKFLNKSGASIQDMRADDRRNDVYQAGVDSRTAACLASQPHDVQPPPPPPLTAEQLAAQKRAQDAEIAKEQAVVVGKYTHKIVAGDTLGSITRDELVANGKASPTGAEIIEEEQRLVSINPFLATPLTPQETALKAPHRQSRIDFIYPPDRVLFIPPADLKLRLDQIEQKVRKGDNNNNGQ